jgi:hypothetical protein
MARRKSKKRNTSKDIHVVLLIVISIILGILIYTKSGYIGEKLTPALRWFNRMGKICFTDRNINAGYIFSTWWRRSG